MTGTALAAPVPARANRPHGVRPRVGLLSGAVNSPVRPGGYLTPWKAANTIKATTMARTGCQSIPRALLSVIEGGVFVDRLARSTS